MKNPCTPAVSKSRGCAGQIAHPVFFFPASRTHVVLSKCVPTHGFCFPGQGKSPRLRRAIRAPGLCLHLSRARGSFWVQAHAELLFSQAGRKPGFCSLQPGKSPRQISDLKRITWGHPFPNAQKRSKKLSSAPWFFRAFPSSAGELRPEGPLSRPAARKRGRSAKGCRRPPLHRNA